MSQKIIDELIKQIGDLHSLYRVPRVIVNTKTFEIKISYIWINKGTKRTCEMLIDELSLAVTKQNEREVARRERDRKYTV